MAFRYIILCSMLIAPALCNSAGAPQEACGDMIPQHHVDPQSSPSPYIISLSKNKIRAGDKVQVTIHGKSPSDTIKGFMVQGRVGNTPVGQFQIGSNSKHTQLLDCGTSKRSAVTHTKIEGTGPQSLTFDWIAPKGLSEHVKFRATVALNGGVFWVGQLSDSLSIN